MIFEYQRKIYGYECDIYGHLNNANYLHLLEAARSEVITSSGVTVNEMKEMGIFLYVAKIEIEFKKGVELDSIATVKTCYKELTKVAANWHQEIYDSEGNLCCKARVKGVFTKENKPYRISDSLYNRFSLLEEK